MKRYKNMDNNQRSPANNQPEMQNWKKQILMDPLLNSLLDEQYSGQHFLHKKVMPLTRTQIAAIYSKLSTISFELTNNLQKEVQTKGHYIEKSYLELLTYKQQYSDSSQKSLTKSKSLECLNFLKNFNKKYQHVEESLNLWKNITIVLNYSKNLQAFRVNVSILKTLMRGYNGNEQTINPIKVAKMLKQIIQLSTRFDFNGLKILESERAFISNTKIVINSIINKNLPKYIQQCCQISDDQKQKRIILQKNVIQWINALSNLGTLRDFIVSFFKNLQNQLNERVKKNIQQNMTNLQTNLNTNLMPFLTQTCISLIFFQQQLITFRKGQLSSLPNLFTKFWQKLCELLNQTLTRIRKDQESKNSPKSRTANIIWKYPRIYDSFAKLCSAVQVYLLNNVGCNAYSFAKNKEKLMVGCLLELATQYHQQVNKIMQSMKGLFSPLIHPQQKYDNILEEKKTPEEKVRNYIESIKILFEEAQCQFIFGSLLKNMANNIINISSKAQSNKITNNASQQLEQDIKTLHIVKIKIKEMLKVWVGKYGIEKSELQAFKQENGN